MNKSHYISTIILLVVRFASDFSVFVKKIRFADFQSFFRFRFEEVLFSLTGFLVVFGGTVATAKMPDFYKEPGISPNRDYVSHHFGENIDPFSGSLQLKYTDISIPGNGGFSLNVVRSYSSSGFKRDAPGAGVTTAGLGWTMHFGRIYRSTNVSASFCVNQVTTSTTDNPVLELPDGSTELFAFVSQTGNELRSRRQWKMTCSATGLIAYSPDGTRYDMDKQQLTPVGITSYYATKITDRNGNYANISYNTYPGTTPSVAEISAVSTSDGRSLSFSYLEPGTISSRISSITGPGGTVSYSYTTIGSSSFPHIYFLTGVSRPSEDSWTYSYNPYSSSGTIGSLQMKSLSMPYGGAINYTYQNITFNSAEIPSSVIASKSANGSWSYAFAPASGIGAEDTTTVTTPDGVETYKHWGPNGVDSGSVWKIGLLTSKTLGSQQTETYSWSSIALGAEPYQRDGSWFAKKDTTTLSPILLTRSINRNGGVYSTTYSGHDSYGNPSTISETGPNSGSRTNSISYFTDTSKWIIGFKKNETANEKGRTIDRNFDTKGNLTSLSRDGATTYYTYTSEGDVASVYTPNGKTTTYSSHYRSVPQAETRPESISVSRIVSSAGNVTSESVGGQTFTYTYDGINRITGITFPVGSAVSVSYSSSSKTVTRGTLVESSSYSG
jgi:YD repeat-containing protein